MKYYNCINRFLKLIYNSEFSELNPQFVTTIKDHFKAQKSNVSCLDIFNAYYELTNLGKFEDALMLHLTYSLRVNPETFSLLTFDAIDK